MDVDPAAWTKDAEYLADDLLRLIGVMQNAVRIDIIEAAILQRKMARVCFEDNCEITDSSAGQLYMSPGHIYAGGQGPMLSELQQIASRSASDFKDSGSPMLAKLCRLIEPWISRVALLLG